MPEYHFHKYSRLIIRAPLNSNLRIFHFKGFTFSNKQISIYKKNFNINDDNYYISIILSLDYLISY